MIVSAGRLSSTVAVAEQRAGGVVAVHAGSPLVTVARLVTLPLPVLVALSVTTVSLVAPIATPAALVHEIVAGPTAEVGVQTQPLPLTRLLIVTPEGTVSVMTVPCRLAPGPPLLTRRV